ncbi:tetratricopeptide repeat protein [Fimbriimonas ginsengisoli]|uniref:Transcriptional regulator, LuxR family n=1 Tax=Fimbriimonas ginsengisoli Gsoil 348 TaxID=661478 RepID=A0A068NR10_FIMGI|nr:tetratricopeptide repeat protein [Fimbriimonas ginsengisoli]AIE85978.1 transcriptional regulator, LuxR family [Fimbriimonas ginsengisoli Gsoil 348]
MYYEPTGRYRLQETVRAYAKELLAESGDEARVRGRHLNYLAEFAERGEPNLLGASAKSWLEALDAERENFRTAIEWSIHAGDPAVGMRLAVALARFFQGRGYIVEGRAVFERLLARSDSLDELSRAKGLRAASVLARSQGDSESAVELGRQSLHLFETAGDLDGAAAAMQALGLASWNLGRIAESQEYTIRSLELRRRQGNLPLVALCLNNLGGATFHQGNYPAALAYYSEALEINRRLGNRPSIAYNLGNIAELALAQGDPGEALALGAESFGMLGELGDRPALVQLLGTLAIALDRLGRGESAARLFGAQTELGEEFKVAIPEIERDAAARAIGECRASIGESSFEKAFAEGRKLHLSEIEEVLKGRP